MRAIDPEQRAELLPAEEAQFASPIPTQIVSSDEYLPARQTEKQREVEARLKDLGAVLANRQGMSRRRFFQTAAGMAASYLVMNQVYGRLFAVSEAEAATPAMAEERAAALKTQTIFDAHTHFLRDDPSPTLSNPARPGSLMWQRALVTRLGWNKDLAGREPTVDDLKFDSFFKEVYLDSDTKIALLTNAPSEAPSDWLLPQEQVFKTRANINREAGSRRMLAHYTLTPSQPGWLEDIDRAIEMYKPDGWKGYTIGDIILTNASRSAYRLDDEKLMYPFYEKAQALRTSASTRVSFRCSQNSASQDLPSMLGSATSAAQPRIGPSSTLSSTIPVTATSVERQPRAWMNGSSATVYHGSAIWPRSQPNMMSQTSMATWVRSSPGQSSRSHA